MIDNVRFGQTIFDFCVWKYGTLQQISRLVLDNGLKYDANVIQGRELIYSEDYGNEDIKDYLEVNGFIPTNGTINLPENFVFEDLRNYIFQDERNYIFESSFGGKPAPEDISFRLTINTALGTGTSFTWPLPSGETYNFTWNPGDGSPDLLVTSYNDVNASYDYGVPFSGKIAAAGKMGGFSFNNGGDRLKITSVDNWGDVGFGDLESAFQGCSNLLTINAGILDLSLLDDLGGFVNGCSSLTSFDVVGWNMTGIRVLSTFIQNCSSLTTFDPSGWVTTSTLTTFIAFANGCSSLATLDLNNLDVSNVSNISFLAQNCTSLTSLLIDSWDTSSVTNMSFLASGCGNLTTFNPSSWDVGNVTTFLRFVRNCSDLTTLNTDGWDTSSVANCSSMCQSCGSLTSSFLDTLWWNRAVPIGTHTNTFTGATNISNYADIPDDWKGL